MGSHVSVLIWTILAVSGALVYLMRSPVAIKILVLTVTLRCILSLGPELTLTFLGVAIVSVRLSEIVPHLTFVQTI